MMNGRYGPYLVHNGTNAPLPRDKNAETITLDEAVAQLAERGKPARGRRGAAKKAPAKKKAATKKKATKKKAATKKPTAKKTPAKRASPRKARASSPTSPLG